MIDRLGAVGDQGLVADCADSAAVQSLLRALRATRPGWVRDLVPGARSVLVRVTPGTDLRPVARWVRQCAGDPQDVAGSGSAEVGRPLVLKVRYDGPDLADVAQFCGLSATDVVAAHGASAWTVAFVGFCPGFAYLCGGDPRLAVPRLAHPRRSVEAGSVGLAAEFTGAYPRESPGGWRIIGHTDARLWDVGRDPPALLRPGMQVRFEAAP